MAFADWVGEVVRVHYGGQQYPDYGHLEEVNEWGLVLRHNRNLSWPDREKTDEYGNEIETYEQREVAELIPWRVIAGVRVLEPEEKAAYGYS